MYHFLESNPIFKNLRVIHSQFRLWVVPEMTTKKYFVLLVIKMSTSLFHIYIIVKGIFFFSSLQDVSLIQILEMIALKHRLRNSVNLPKEKQVMPKRVLLFRFFPFLVNAHWKCICLVLFKRYWMNHSFKDYFIKEYFI